MNFRDLPGVAKWIEQFAMPDQYLAEFALQKFRYVGFQEFEEWIQGSVVRLVEEIETNDHGRSAIALFPVQKPPGAIFGAPRESKQTNDSAGRVAHALKNIERVLPKHVELTPRLESMRARRVRHIVFVDDFVGTGDRFISYWRTSVARSVKSWCSRGWTKIWFLTFAGHAEGIAKIVRTVKPAVRERIRINVEIERNYWKEAGEVHGLFGRYGFRVGRRRGAFGYGDLLSPVIFQHGCPNNASELLWLSARKSLTNWKPLFPNRSVPKALYPLFTGDVALEATPEQLWIVGHYEIALNMIERIDDFREHHRLVLALALIDSGKDLESVKGVFLLSEEEFKKFVSVIRSSGLIGEGGKLSSFGRELLARAGRYKRRKRVRGGDYEFFYPSTFLGFQRSI